MSYIIQPGLSESLQMQGYWSIIVGHSSFLILLLKGDQTDVHECYANIFSSRMQDLFMAIMCLLALGYSLAQGQACSTIGHVGPKNGDAHRPFLRPPCMCKVVLEQNGQVGHTHVGFPSPTQYNLQTIGSNGNVHRQS